MPSLTYRDRTRPVTQALIPAEWSWATGLRSRRKPEAKRPLRRTWRRELARRRLRGPEGAKNCM
jgi:hypothetical protein